MLEQEGVSKAVGRAHLRAVAIRAAAAALLLQPMQQLVLLAGRQLRMHVLRGFVQCALLLCVLLCS